MKNKVLIIAEAGVNHNGDLSIAMKMIDAAKKAGADAIKFQTFKTEMLVSKYASKAEYQKKFTEKDETQFVMIKKLELGIEAHQILIDECDKKGIIFISSPFDLESIDILSRLQLKIIKIPSSEITNLPYLRKLGSLNKKIIMSTGMATLKEVKDALDTMVSCGTKKSNITILHCNTEYPTPMEDVNLKAMVTIKNKLNVKVGYSDHTLGIEVPVAAAALGADVIEKHFTLDKNMAGPDHKASIEPDELKAMIMAIRNIEKALGRGIKKPSKSEIKNIEPARKSIVAACDIRKGERFSCGNMTVKRPGNGINPMKWDSIAGKRAKKNFKAEEFIVL